GPGPYFHKIHFGYVEELPMLVLLLFSLSNFFVCLLNCYKALSLFIFYLISFTLFDSDYILNSGIQWEQIERMTDAFIEKELRSPDIAKRLLHGFQTS
ncbi:hypothetical protein, partial [Acinetobacter baumannii]|uniref:hypothetical protein n=1 Tax=Acinetobacter baumannii TaxID=470 RepID=UPI001C07E975